MKKLQERKVPAKALLAVRKQVIELCASYNKQIVCEVTPLDRDYEQSVRIQNQEGGYTGSLEEGNTGNVYVSLYLPQEVWNMKNEIISKVAEMKEVARVFLEVTRIKVQKSVE